MATSARLPDRVAFLGPAARRPVDPTGRFRRGQEWWVSDGAAPRAHYLVDEDPADATRSVWRQIGLDGPGGNVTSVAGEDGIFVDPDVGDVVVVRQEAFDSYVGDGPHGLPADLEDVIVATGMTEGKLNLPDLGALTNTRTRTIRYDSTDGACAIFPFAGQTISGLPSLVLYGQGEVLLLPIPGASSWSVVQLARGTSDNLTIYASDWLATPESTGFSDDPIFLLKNALLRVDETKWRVTGRVIFALAESSDNLEEVTAIPGGVGPNAGPLQLLASLIQLPGTGTFEATAVTSGVADPAVPATIEMANDPGVTASDYGCYVRFTSGGAVSAGPRVVGQVAVGATTVLTLAGVYGATGAAPGDEFVLERPGSGLGNSTSKRIIPGSGNRLFVQGWFINATLDAGIRVHINTSQTQLETSVVGGAILYAGDPGPGFEDVTLTGRGAMLISNYVGTTDGGTPAGPGAIVAKGCLVLDPTVLGAGASIVAESSMLAQDSQPSSTGVTAVAVGAQGYLAQVYATTGVEFLRGAGGRLANVNFGITRDAATALLADDQSHVSTNGLYGASSGAGGVGAVAQYRSSISLVDDAVTGLVGAGGNDYKVGANAFVNRATIMAGGAASNDLSNLATTQACTIQVVP